MNDLNTFYAFLLVFIRTSAMLISSPVFGAQNTPLQVRIFTTLAISAALSMIVQSFVPPVPPSMLGLGEAVLMEAMYGLLIGGMVQLALQAASIAGGVLDLQTGLSFSHTINPLDGHNSSVLTQFKTMFAMVIFLVANGHHYLIQALVASYSLSGGHHTLNLDTLQREILSLLQAVCELGLQIATPVIAVSLVTDAALGLINRAVPQMQASIVGLPAKLAMGLIAVSFSVPALVLATNTAVGVALESLSKVMR